MDPFEAWRGTDFGGWALAWLALAIAVVALGDRPFSGPLVRYSLLLVVLYLLIANVGRIRPLVDELVAGLGRRPTVSRDPAARARAA